MEIAVTADGTVAQHGDGLGLLDGQMLVKLDDDQASALLTLLGSDVASGGLTFADGVFTAVPAPPPPPPPDPLKPYRDALSTAAASDGGLSTDTKTALMELLAAMAPR